MKKLIALLLVVLMMLCTVACGDTAESAKPSGQSEAAATAELEATPEPTPEPTEAPDPGAELVAQYEAYMAEGNYYDAAQTIIRCENESSDSEILDQCPALLGDVYTQLADSQPESGTVFERTFKYNGGGELHIVAQSGNVEAIVTDLDDPMQYVRFFVRQGEEGFVNLPGGSYDVSFKVGFVWFNDDIGFGDIYSEDKLDEPLEFDVSMDNAWITNSVWTVTI